MNGGSRFSVLRMLGVLVVVSVMLAGSSSLGFDGQRKGFVLGGGLGFAPVSQFGIGGGHEGGVGLGINFLIGYGLDKQNMFVYEANLSYRGSDFYSEQGQRTLNWDTWEIIGDQTITQGFGGAVWYHYFDTTKHALFSAVGVGGYNLMTSGLGDNDLGLGFLVGGGYSIATHLQAGVYFSAGSSYDGPVRYDHVQLSMLVSYVAF
jgi:hypothetical protein